jgi:hypothetical protein
MIQDMRFPGIPATPGRHMPPLLRIEHLWPLATMVLIFAFTSTHPIRPHDFWWHLKAGQEIITSGGIPATDSFSYTAPGRPYENYKAYWLMEAALYLLYSRGGPALVIFAHSLAITAAYGVLLYLCRRVSRSWRIAAAATFFAAVLGYNDWNVRPQSIAFLLAAICLCAIYLYRWEQRPWLLPVFPVVALIWVNSHGSFFVGLALLAIWLLDETWQALRTRHLISRSEAFRRLWPPLLALSASILACLANPRGPGIIAYLGALPANPIVRNLIVEWAPPSFASLGGTLFLAGMLFAAVVLALSPRRPSFFELVTFLVFAGLGLQARRGSVWFGLAMAPVLAGHFAALVAKYLEQEAAIPNALDRANGALPPHRLMLNYLFAALLLCMALLSLPWFKNLLPLPEARAPLISSETPVEATHSLLASGLPGRLFHDMVFGSYLIWAAQPAYPVFADPRIELYPPEVWADYLDLSAAHGDWEGKLCEYGVNTLMLSPAGQPRLIQAAAQSSHWRLVYQDPHAVILTRQDQVSHVRPQGDTLSSNKGSKSQ